MPSSTPVRIAATLPMCADGRALCERGEDLGLFIACFVEADEA